MIKNIYILIICVLATIGLHSQSNILPPGIPSNDLYGYWPLDGNVSDISGNNYDGTTDGSYSTDAFENENSSVYLNNQMIILPVNDQLNSDNFTIQFWTKAVSYNIHNKVQFGEINGESRWVLNWADTVSPLFNDSFLYYHPSICSNGSAAYAENGNDTQQIQSIDRDTWHLLTFVVDGQSTSFYRNGELITSLNEASELTCYNNDMSVYFGGDVGGGAIEYYNGWFDNIGIWTRSLSVNEIETIYNSSNCIINDDNIHDAVDLWVSDQNAAEELYGNISDWDTSCVTNMSGLFQGKSNFNEDLSGWNVSNVTDMSNMFYNAGAFNQDIGSWDVSNVLDMGGMFRVTSFNQDISNWNVGNVQNMTYMFSNAVFFNQDIGSWDVSNVNSMNWMFNNAYVFNQNLGNWNVTSVISMVNMLSQSGLSFDNYDSFLIGWSQQDLQTGVNFGAESIFYCLAEAERQSIIDNFNWIINDSGTTIDCNVPSNTTPLSFSQNGYAFSGELTNIQLDVSDQDGDALTYTLVDPPAMDLLCLQKLKEVVLFPTLLLLDSPVVKPLATKQVMESMKVK